MEADSLIRVSVLCDLLAQTLDAVDDEGFKSPQFLDELRALRDRAAEELAQLGESGGE
ncbi:MAG TPA: hypothetical protein VJ716_09240 [Gaiellaceae bacterium]|nr:hypothetical protein [Gaiellaceae bacterium]